MIQTAYLDMILKIRRPAHSWSLSTTSRNWDYPSILISPRQEAHPLLSLRDTYRAQLVVVGDQSTGKSSVLQAVTELPFPTNDKMCTRFATEIVLRRTLPDTPTQIDISIIPDSDESLERRESLLAWRPKGCDKTAGLNKLALKQIIEQVWKTNISLYYQLILFSGRLGRRSLGKLAK